MKSKIYDCFMFNNENDLLKIRLNVLNDYVDYFVIVESAETHSGLKKKLNFNISNFPEFKDKIIYGVIKKFPNNFSSWEKENYQRNYITKLLNKAEDNDYILISDLDEIPNLKELDLNILNEKIIVFQQRLFFYKLNLGETQSSWYGSKCIKKKNLKSPQWLRNLKVHKKYKFYRIDKIFFSKNYDNNFKIIKNGGWHFTWMGNINLIREKLNHTAHVELNKIEINNDEFIKDTIKSKKSIDPKQKLKLIKIPLNEKFLPRYILSNLHEFKHMISGEM